VKISWGTGITISIVLFTAISLWFAYFAFNQEVNLVSDDYYEAEIKFDERMETIKRTELLSEKLKINMNQGLVELIFPNKFIKKQIIGEILFYRPSDRNLDLSFPIKLDSTNTQFLDTKIIKPGLWKMQIHWIVDYKEYFNEKSIMVQ